MSQLWCSLPPESSPKFPFLTDLPREKGFGRLATGYNSWAKRHNAYKYCQAEQNAIQDAEIKEPKTSKFFWILFHRK